MMMKLILLAIVSMAIASPCLSQQPVSTSMKKIDHVYTVFITKKLKETVRFYEQYFAFTKVFESTFFVLLQTADEKFYVAFMDEKHPTTPPTPQQFNGSGSFLTLTVSDCKMVYNEIKSRGLKIDYPLKDEAWGQRRFGVIDPNNMWVDVVQQIEPEAGFWNPYMKE
jgi:uncharacterized glyoxalase superfamily protein PhnB